jgi:hypothetical protein
LTNSTKVVVALIDIKRDVIKASTFHLNQNHLSFIDHFNEIYRTDIVFFGDSVLILCLVVSVAKHYWASSKNKLSAS